MSPVLKKRHSKSCVPLFSKNQGFALLHIPFLSHFLQSKKQLPFRNCFPVYSLFYFQKPFPLAFSFISVKTIPPQIASDEILHTTPHHPSQVQNVEKNKSYATFQESFSALRFHFFIKSRISSTSTRLQNSMTSPFSQAYTAGITQ